MSNEFLQKHEKIKKLCVENSLDGVLLTRLENVRWMTGGAIVYTPLVGETSKTQFLIMNDKKYVIAPNNEIERLLYEDLLEQGYEPKTHPWHDDRKKKSSPN